MMLLRQSRWFLCSGSGASGIARIIQEASSIEFRLSSFWYSKRRKRGHIAGLTVVKFMWRREHRSEGGLKRTGHRQWTSVHRHWRTHGHRHDGGERHAERT